MYCKDCEHYYGEGLCRTNRKGYTSALLTADGLACFSPAEKINKPMEETTKVCKDCGRELPLDQFPKNRHGYLGICRECNKKRHAPKSKTEGEKLGAEVAENLTRQIIPKIKQNMPGRETAVLRDVSDEALAAELRARGYAGTLTKSTTLTL